MSPFRASAVGPGGALRAVALLLAGGTVLALGAEPPPGTGPDPDLVPQCTGCHPEEGVRWASISSHSLVLDCFGCHAETRFTTGAGHVETAPCTGCHSETAHPEDADCAACHEPHGTDNAFLVRERVELPTGLFAPVHVSLPEGASEHGLVRQGLEGSGSEGSGSEGSGEAGPIAGTGLCEVCHEETRYYRRDGLGDAHDGARCSRCHDHQRGYLPGGE